MFPIMYSDGATPYVAFTICFAIVICIVQTILKLLKKQQHWCAFEKSSRVLLFTAHPDDECMFFGPTISCLLKRNCKLFLICFTTGNFRGDGNQRSKELYKSCEILGINKNNIMLYNCTSFPDNPGKTWNLQLLRKIISQYTEALGIDTLITFDGYGVSGHKNHISLYECSESIQERGLISEKCKIYHLQSVNILRKYIGIFDKIFTVVNHDFSCSSNAIDRKGIREALAAHESQYVWFRKLFIIFSRYIFINTYTREK